MYYYMATKFLVGAGLVWENFVLLISNVPKVFRFVIFD